MAKTTKITKVTPSAKPHPGAKTSPHKVNHVVYSLNLAVGKKYVGKTDDLNKRMGAHFSGHGAEWTKKNAPVSINHVQVCKTAASQAKAETIVYGKMRDYHGPYLVRGAGNTTSK